jgi:drug/metabolite transporter (DMT)-like permease
MLAMAAYYYFSLIGKKEGIVLQKNIWVLCMLAATLMSSANALYDKYILVNLDLDLASVQAYSALQRAVIAMALLPFIMQGISFKGLLSENWALTALAVTYVAAEFVYLWAVNTEGALISVISVLRRTNLIMVFGLSALLLHENYVRQKIAAIVVVLMGILLVALN